MLVARYFDRNVWNMPSVHHIWTITTNVRRAIPLFPNWMVFSIYIVYSSFVCLLYVCNVFLLSRFLHFTVVQFNVRCCCCCCWCFYVHVLPLPMDFPFCLCLCFCFLFLLNFTDRCIKRTICASWWFYIHARV